MHAWYYDLTPDRRLTTDTDPDGGCLVWLCEWCAREHALEIEFASTDTFYDGPCHLCNHSVGD